MSSVAGTHDGATAGATAQSYFCHQCNDTVFLTPSPSIDITCPICNGGFLEEQEIPNPDINPNITSLFASDFLSSIFPIFSPPTRSVSNPNRNLENPIRVGPDEFNPVQFLQNYLQELRDDGANVQFVIENQGSDDRAGFGGLGGLGFGLPANLGDYFVGPGLEQLIQQLAENDPNRHGTPPASKDAVKELRNVIIDDEILGSDLAQCAVCKDEFEMGVEVKQMPCKHLYHSECILPWLELHNSCPVCRYELPTDDPEYENSGAENSVVGGAGGVGGVLNSVGGVLNSVGGGEGSLQTTPRLVERRFRISLPPSFTWGLFGNQNDGGSSSDEQQHRRFGSRPGEGDLD